jgi:CheY-like chemotaxis protein
LIKIVIADDDREFRELIVFALRFAGLFTFGAASGDECLSLVKLHQPDLILLDFNLLKIYSSPLYDLLNSNVKTASIPLVILFIKGQQSEIHKTYSKRVLGFIDKSDSPDKITRQVMHYLRKAEKPNP